MTRRTAELGLEAIAIEGGLIAPEQVAAIAATERTAKTAAEYGVPKGLSLGDEISRYFRIGQAIWRDYARIDAPTVTQTAAFARDLLSQAFGFDDLAGPAEHRDGTRRYRIAWEALGGRVPVVVAAPAVDEKERDIGFTKALPEFGDGSEGRPRRSPIVLLQDWLNGTDAALWGLVFAGDRVRLMRDNASLTRAAWIEADLRAMFRDEMFADFTAWWLLTHASRFGKSSPGRGGGAREARDGGGADTGAPVESPLHHQPLAGGPPPRPGEDFKSSPSACPLEKAREAGLKEGTAARERLREGVENALRELGQGLVDANPAIRDRMAGDPAAVTALFEELLRTVYRLIFLAVAEDRGLLHPRGAGQRARDLYAGSYGFGFWRERSARRAAYDAHHDAWEGMKVTLAALEQGQPLLGLPALGGLFARDATPVLTGARIPNRRFLPAVHSLGYITVESRLTRINWRDMKTEELGSVYESLLELRPFLSPAGEFTLAGVKGNARKTSGSYYTPDSLVETLLDSALDPVLQDAESGNREQGAGSRGAAASAPCSLLPAPHDPVEAILNLRVIDPACGSGHFLLGAARRMADRVAALRDPDAPDVQGAMRDVVSRCIHGVDRNPMAVELAKVALWIESVSPGQPLGFLDANIRCGDALLGVFDLAALEEGVPDEAYKPLTGDSKAAARYYLQQNRAAKRGQGQFDWPGGGGAMPPKRLAANLSTIKALPEDSVAQVDAKRRRYEAWRSDPARWATKIACDLYTAAFLLPKTEVPLNGGRNMVPTTADVRARLAGGSVYGPLEAAAEVAASTARALHWPLAFPDVMVGRGGFDVVLGNPPYLSALEQSRMGIDREREYWRYSKQSARGAFDIYVLFLDLGLALSPKGRCSLLTPNKYLSAPYGEALRTVIRDRDCLESIVDESAGGHFVDASVYPVITNFSSGADQKRVSISSFIPSSEGWLTIKHKTTELYRLPNVNLGPLLSKNAPLLYRVLRQTVPLSSICEVNASTTASEADEFTEALIDDDSASSVTAWRVLNTGLIDPFREKWGQQALRHAKKAYKHPIFEKSSSVIPSRRKEHYSSPKLVFAKLAGQPEVFVDELGNYAALNVNFAFLSGDEAFFLAAQLNSVVGDWLYRQLFGALAMSGGFLQYQAPQIRSWPVQRFDHQNPIHLETVRLARNFQAGDTPADPTSAVARCFGLADSDLEVIAAGVKESLDATADDAGEF